MGSNRLGPLLAAALGFVSLACGHPASDGGGAHVTVSVSSALESREVTAVRLAVSRDGVQVADEELARAGSQYTGVFDGLRPGTYLFSARALAGAEVLYSHEVTVEIQPKLTADVRLRLQQVAPPSAYVNGAPWISGTILDRTEVAPGERVSIFVFGEDADARYTADGVTGETLTFTWSASGGTVYPTWTGPITASADWIAPAAEGDYAITIGITDSKGASGGITLSFASRAANAKGGARVVATLNHWPDVSAIRLLDPVSLLPLERQLLVSETAVLAADAADADGEALAHAWSVEGCGDAALRQPGTASPTFVAPSRPTAHCTIRLHLSDASGGHNDSSIELGVARPPDPPMLDEIFQSRSSAAPGDLVVLRMYGHTADPATPIEGHFQHQSSALELVGTRSLLDAAGVPKGFEVTVRMLPLFEGESCATGPHPRWLMMRLFTRGPITTQLEHSFTVDACGP